MLFVLHSGQREGQSEETEEIQNGFKCVVIEKKNLQKEGEKQYSITPLTFKHPFVNIV